jgi:hypothetical protein
VTRPRHPAAATSPVLRTGRSCGPAFTLARSTCFCGSQTRYARMHRHETTVGNPWVSEEQGLPIGHGGVIALTRSFAVGCARRKVQVPALARWLLRLGITATLAANIAHSLGHGLTGAAVAAWPAVALVGSYELLMMIIRSARLPGTGTALGRAPECMPDTDPLRMQAAQAFAVGLAAGRATGARDPCPAACWAATCPAGTRIPGRAQRRADWRVPRTSRCDL